MRGMPAVVSSVLYEGLGKTAEEPSICCGLVSRKPVKLEEPWDTLQDAPQPVPPGSSKDRG